MSAHSFSEASADFSGSSIVHWSSRQFVAFPSASSSGSSSGLQADHENTREEYGSPEDYRLFREAGNPNEIVVIAEWESAEAFQRFMEESDVKEKMGELGVISEPEVYILEETEAKTSEQPPA